MIAFAPHQQRVVDELTELVIKQEALKAFLTKPFFQGLPEAEQARLCRQHAYMLSYRQVLEERIEAFRA